MEKFKAYASLFLAMVSFFILGLYASNVSKVQPHQWFMTGTFSIFFTVMAINKIRELNK